MPCPPSSRYLLGLTFIILLLLPSSSTGVWANGDGGNGDRHPRGEEKADRIVLATANLTAIFEGKKPRIKFFAGAPEQEDSPLPKFEVRFKRLLEFNDTNRDGAFQKREETAKAEIEGIRWTRSPFYNLTGADGRPVGLGINFTAAEPLKIERRGGPEQLANVSVRLVVKAYRATRIGTERVGNQNVSMSVVGQMEVKVDVLLGNWPFGNQSAAKLALEMRLKSKLNQFEVDERDGRRREDANRTQAEARRMNQTRLDEQRISFLREGGVIGGFFKFVNRAKVTPPRGAPSLVNVTASLIAEREDGEQELKVFVTYPRFQGQLLHDPSFGVGQALVVPEFPTGVAGFVAVLLLLSLLPRVMRRRSLFAANRVQRPSTIS